VAGCNDGVSDLAVGTEAQGCHNWVGSRLIVSSGLKGGVVKKKDSVALKLPFEPGEFLCTWRVPGLKGEPVELSGLLNLEVGKYPSGVLHGDVPIKWVNGGAGFPQQQKFDSLVGLLSSGGSVALMGGELSYWFTNQGRASAAFAVLSRDELDAKEPRKYQAIELQIDGLDAMMGQAPISQVTMPFKAGAERVWSATINSEAHSDWEMGDEKMSLCFNASISAFDAYEFHMVFGSVVSITSTIALTAAQWWLQWVRPLRQLVSLTTQSPREIHCFLAIQDADEPHASRDQVFGWDITQSTQNASRRAVEEVQTLVNLRVDDANLLALLQSWRRLSREHHPLVETYGSMTTMAEQHPRSRVLLLLQALEGLYGFETSERRAEKEEAHLKNRAAVLERAKNVLELADMKFIRENLPKRPPGGLHDALTSIFESLPVDIRSQFEATDLFALVRSSYEGFAKARTEEVLAQVRNLLSHGSATFDPRDLLDVADLLERVARAETLRVIGAPDTSRRRALEKS
jgi:ApeA N-terminal domain 1